MTTKTITLTDEDAILLGQLLSRALDTDPALNTGDEPSVRALLSDLQAPEDINAGQPSLLDPVPDTLFADRLFSEEDVISRYAREDAIADGALVDVSPWRRRPVFSAPWP